MPMMPYQSENLKKVWLESNKLERAVNRERSKHKLCNIFSVVISLFDTVSANQSNETVIHQRVSRWVSLSFKESFIW